jgi:hypothetical protein
LGAADPERQRSADLKALDVVHHVHYLSFRDGVTVMVSFAARKERRK